MYTNICFKFVIYTFVFPVANVDCTHIESATVSFKDLVTITRENSTNQQAVVLVDDPLHPPSNLVTVSHEQEHKLNSRSEH